jgi:hypothetical protein
LIAPQLPQRFGFDLSHPLPGHAELFADLFQCVICIPGQTKTHGNHHRFAFGELAFFIVVIVFSCSSKNLQ